MTIVTVEPVFFAISALPARSVKACPAVYVVMTQWPPTDSYVVI